MDQFWYFGGSVSANNRQVNSFHIFFYEMTFFKVSKISGCQLVRQNDMSFNFDQGSCNSFARPTPKILLCFGSGTDCHT